MKRWAVTFDLVKQSPYVGYGSGDELDLLKEKYYSEKLYGSYLNDLNAHNQYISFLLSGGVIALAIYFFTLLYGLQMAITSKNLIFIGFIILIITVSASENLLMRNKGIFFYSFFFSFFFITERKTKEKHLTRQLAPEFGNPVPQSYVYTDN
jgi:O-antigen ligase